MSPLEYMETLLEALSLEWKLLDDTMLIPKDNVKNQREKGAHFICLPPKMNIWNSSSNDFNVLNHPRIPESKKVEYLSRLSEIFCRVLPYKSVQSRFEESSLSVMKIKKHLDKLTTFKSSKLLRGLTKDVVNSNLKFKKKNNLNIPQRNDTSTNSNDFRRRRGIPSNHVDTVESIITVHIQSSRDEEHCDQVIDILGSMTLNHLSRSLYCVHNFLPCSDIYSYGNYIFLEGDFYIDDPENWLEIVTGEDQGQACDSEFLAHLEENYNYQSFKKTVDIITSIIKWMQSTKQTYKTVDSNQQNNQDNGQCSEERVVGVVEYCRILRQQDYRIGSMNLVLAKRYLFSHHCGRCEHFLYFSDVRLFNPREDQVLHDMSTPDALPAFPRVRYYAPWKRRTCNVCLAWSARYVVYGDRLADENPCFFCEHCYHLLHYSPDGDILYDDFTVFPYLHDM